jgi:hypothetical protein
MSPITTSTSVSSLLDEVHQIEPVIRAHTADAERERRLPMPSSWMQRTIWLTGCPSRNGRNTTQWPGLAGTGCVAGARW